MSTLLTTPSTKRHLNHPPITRNIKLNATQLILIKFSPASTSIFPNQAPSRVHELPACVELSFVFHFNKKRLGRFTSLESQRLHQRVRRPMTELNKNMINTATAAYVRPISHVWKLLITSRIPSKMFVKRYEP